MFLVCFLTVSVALEKRRSIELQRSAEGRAGSSEGGGRGGEAEAREREAARLSQQPLRP